MSTQETMTTAAKLRSAEETVERAQAALDKARAGLHAAEAVASKAEKATARPLQLTLGIAVFAGLVALIVMMVRNREEK